jgi:aryl-alcohol dehydrogenase-like predicted oxidoreductase
VTSFSAFSSAPIYDAENAERRIGNLLRERRRQIALTSEFARTRLQFARNSVGAIISKSMKIRSGSIGSAGK